MRRAFLFAIALLVFTATSAFARDIVIEDFRSDIVVEASGKIRVVETLKVRFNGSFNGIFRDIPYGYTYPGGARGDIRLTVNSVKDDAGTDLEHWEKRRRGQLNLKIRVPGANDATRIVVIQYSAEDVIREYDEEEEAFGRHDQLYWNVTGDEWQVPILHASALVTLPDSVPSDGIVSAAYVGAYGSRGREFRTDRPSETQVSFETTETLPPHAGLTIVVGFPVGHVAHPTFFQRLLWFFQANWYALIPLLLLLAWFHIWRKYGRDALEGRTIIPQWEAPMGLTAAEVGVVMDDTLDRRDLTAAIVGLAVRGVLRIHQQEDDDYQLELVEGGREKAELSAFEKVLLDGLFTGGKQTVALSSLSQKFYAKIPSIRRLVLDGLVKRGLFPKAPDKVSQRWIGFTVLALGACVFLGFLLRWPWPFWLALVVSAVPMFILAAHMPRRTAKGLDALAGVLGLEEYMRTAEKERMKQASMQHFEALLPFAIALNVHDAWTQAFAGLFDQPPDWMDGRGAWDAYWMSRWVTGMNRSVSSTLYSVPRSSSGGSGHSWGGGWSGGSGFGGGGFSGGGFGGGGGGGW